jgi:hypothetical protein
MSEYWPIPTDIATSNIATPKPNLMGISDGLFEPCWASEFGPIEYLHQTIGGLVHN